MPSSNAEKMCMILDSTFAVMDIEDDFDINPIKTYTSHAAATVEGA
jgi:hypothetical protein